MEKLEKIIKDSEQYFREQAEESPQLPYHNRCHTENVVRSVGLIGQGEGLSERQVGLLKIAGWFHDMAYDGGCTGHEERSASMAREFLEGKLSEEDLALVERAILATRMPQNPSDHFESVMCDADLSHLGMEGYFDISEALRQECSIENGKISKSNWALSNLGFMSAHRYFTDYALKHFGPVKARHIKDEMERLKETLNGTQETAGEKNQGKKKKDKGSKGEKGDKEVPETKKTVRRDLETMYRIMARNHISFSVIADRKANILLSINSVIVSFCVGILFRKAEEWPEMLVPSIIFALTGLITVILTVIVTRPNVTKGRFSKEDIDQNKVNLLFFGNFHGMSLGEFQDALKKSNQTPNEVYDNLSRDVFYLGKVLNLKYKRLHRAFNFFMFGITLSVISFILFFFFWPK